LFEPNPASVAELRSHVSERMVLNAVGLGAVEGTVTFFRHSDSVNRRAYFQCPEDCACKTVVPVVRLDTYVREHQIPHIDFIKIDTEGYELEVLKGAQAVLPLVDAIQFEYGGTYADSGITLNDVYVLLRNHGFGFVYLIC